MLILNITAPIRKHLTKLPKPFGTTKPTKTAKILGRPMTFCNNANLYGELRLQNEKDARNLTKRTPVTDVNVNRVSY